MKIYKLTTKQIDIFNRDLKTYRQLGLYILDLPYEKSRLHCIISIHQDEVDFGDKWINKITKKPIADLNYTPGDGDNVESVNDSRFFYELTLSFVQDWFCSPLFELYFWTRRDYYISLTLKGFPEDFCREIALKYGNYYSFSDLRVTYDLKKTYQENIEKVHAVINKNCFSTKEELIENSVPST